MSEQEAEPIINLCPECGDPIDVTAQPPYSKIACPHCDQAIRVRTALGRFHIQRMLGEGGMSQVFLADDTMLKRQVALKILHAEFVKNHKLTAQFEREAKLTASINHPNVVKVYTVGTDQGLFFIAMELVDNVSWEHLITEKGRASERETLEVAYDVTSGLKAAFQGGLIHRDIKPGNILQTPGGVSKLVDFGLSIRQGGEEEESDELWATPFYVPPEQLHGLPEDFRSDIYSLGATLYHLVAGVPPYDAHTSSIQELMVIKEEKISLADVAPDVSPGTVQLIDRMMAYDPAKRPSSYDELLESIDSLLESMPGGQRRSRQRGRAEGTSLAIKLSLASLALVGIVGAAIYFSTRPSDSNGGVDLLMTGGEERVLTAGELNIAKQYTAAREQLAKGQFQKAHEVFNALLAKEDLKQPTRNWTRFHAALSALFLGKETEAREIFAEMAADKEAFTGESETAKALEEFFKTVGREMSDTLPVMESRLEVNSKGGGSGKADEAPAFPGALAYLAGGLKNWNQNEFASAVELLTAFKKAPESPSYEWAAAYKPLVDLYLGDARILADAPKPSATMADAQLQKLAGQLKKQAEELKTRGAASKWLQARERRALKFIEDRRQPTVADATQGGDGTGAATGDSTSASAAPAGGEGPEMKSPGTGADAEQREKLKAALAELADLGLDYRFSDAAAKLEELDVQGEAVKTRLDDELQAYEHAGDLLGVLIASLDGEPFDGVVLRKEGVPLEAKVSVASSEVMIVDLGFGPNEIPIEDLAPGWWVDLARARLLQDSPPAANPETWSRAACFARQLGEKAAAAEFANAVAPYSPPFREYWERLNGDW